MCKLLMLPSLFLYFLLESYPDTTMLTTFPLSTPCQNHIYPTRMWFVSQDSFLSPTPCRVGGMDFKIKRVKLAWLLLAFLFF